MKIETEFKRIARRAGGLFLGLRYDFRGNLLDDSQFPAVHYQERLFCFGLLAWVLRIRFQTGHRTEDDGC